MGIGTGIFLLVVGAILKFAFNGHVSGVDVQMIGLICMGAGILALLLGLVQNAQRQRVTTEAVVEHRETGLPRETRDPRV